QPDAREPLLIGLGRFFLAFYDDQRGRRIIQGGQRSGWEIGAIATTFRRFVLDRLAVLLALAWTVGFQSAVSARLALRGGKWDTKAVPQLSVVAFPAQH